MISTCWRTRLGTCWRRRGSWRTRWRRARDRTSFWLWHSTRPKSRERTWRTNSMICKLKWTKQRKLRLKCPCWTCLHSTDWISWTFLLILNNYKTTTSSARKKVLPRKRNSNKTLTEVFKCPPSTRVNSTLTDSSLLRAQEPNFKMKTSKKTSEKTTMRKTSKITRIQET